jgi:hypothetical protein
MISPMSASVRVWVILDTSKLAFSAVLGQTNVLPRIANGVALDRNYAYIDGDGGVGHCLLGQSQTIQCKQNAFVPFAQACF